MSCEQDRIEVYESRNREMFAIRIYGVIPEEHMACRSLALALLRPDVSDFPV